MLFPVCCCGSVFSTYCSCVSSDLPQLINPSMKELLGWMGNLVVVSSVWSVTQVPCNTLGLPFKSSHLALSWFTSEHSSDCSLCLLQMSCHPELNQYIQDTLHCVKPLLEKVRSYWGPGQKYSKWFWEKVREHKYCLHCKIYL